MRQTGKAGTAVGEEKAEACAWPRLTELPKAEAPAKAALLSTTSFSIRTGLSMGLVADQVKLDKSKKSSCSMQWSSGAHCHGRPEVDSAGRSGERPDEFLGNRSMHRH